MEYKEEYKLPINMVLNITDACDLRCTYCFCEKNPHFISLNIAKQSIEWLMNNYHRKQELNPNYTQHPSVAYFGGEPTLLWNEIIVPLTDWAKEKYPEIQFTITTNGTLLNKERIAYMKERNIFPLLSIDGDASIQDVNRPYIDGRGSSKDIEAIIPDLLSAFPNTTFRATVDQSTCGDIFNATYMYAMRLGFRNLFLCPNARDTWHEDSVKKFQQEIAKISIHRITTFDNDRWPIGMSQYDKIHKHILMTGVKIKRGTKEPLAQNRSVIRCGLGTGSVSVGYDGRIYGCQEQDSRSTNNYFLLGDVENGINEERHKALLEDYNKYAIILSEEPGLCDLCGVRDFCINSVCPSVSHDKFGTFFIRPRIDCLLDQWIYDGCLLAMDYLAKQNCKEFKDYLFKVLERGE